jgi:hypothetical protein
VTRASTTLCALALLAACGAEGPPDAGPPAGAEAYRSGVVAGTIEAAAQRVRTRGFEPDGAERRGFLVERATEVAEADLASGSCYVLLATASSGVRELELRLFDAEGSPLAQDGATGPRSVLPFCPSRSGRTYVAVTAATGSGLYALRRFVGPSGLDLVPDDVFPRDEETP